MERSEKPTVRVRGVDVEVRKPNLYDKPTTLGPASGNARQLTDEYGLPCAHSTYAKPSCSTCHGKGVFTTTLARRFDLPVSQTMQQVCGCTHSARQRARAEVQKLVAAAKVAAQSPIVQTSDGVELRPFKPLNPTTLAQPRLFFRKRLSVGPSTAIVEDVLQELDEKHTVTREQFEALMQLVEPQKP